LALNLHERAGHHDEVADALHVEDRHDVEVVLELLEDARDGDVADVHLVALDEVQQQVERAAERVEIDLVIVHERWPVARGWWLVYPAAPTAARLVRMSSAAYTVHRYTKQARIRLTGIGGRERETNPAPVRRIARREEPTVSDTIDAG